MSSVKNQKDQTDSEVVLMDFCEGCGFSLLIILHFVSVPLSIYLLSCLMIYNSSLLSCYHIVSSTSKIEV